MDNNSIRSVGATTLVDIWIDGKLRSICVTRSAIVEIARSGAGPGGRVVR